MVFKLDKSDLKRKQELVDQSQELFTALETAIEAFNETLEAAKETLIEAVTAYNEKLSEFKEFTDDIASQGDDALQEKSEKWQEGDRGSSAQEWINEWENVEFANFEPDLPDTITLDVEAPGDTLDGLSEDAFG